MNIIGLVGRHGRGSAGAGKSTVAKFLAEDHGYVEVALSDPMKRFLREIFNFSDEQLWGSSEKRNADDVRYERPRGAQKGQRNIDVYLSPRVALQKLGTEWGRAMYEDVWINKALKDAQRILEEDAEYDPKYGLDLSVSTPRKGIVIADVRFPNELRRIREVGGKIWRIDRPAPGGFDEEVLHASEAGLDGETFDEIVSNEGTLEHLRELVNITIKRTAR